MKSLLHPALVLLLLHAGITLEAKSVTGSNPTMKADSSGSHWKILTDAKSRKTRVQFFASDQTLLYEEEIPEKWIKQNKRNRQRLDRLLADINANKLIVSRLRTQELSAEPVKAAASVQPENTSPADEQASYRIHVAINSDGKIRLAVDNPKILRYKIEIVDYKERIIYQEFTSLGQYRRYIDISPAISQAAQLILTIDKKRLIYNITREERKSNYTITPVRMTNAFNSANLPSRSRQTSQYV